GPAQRPARIDAAQRAARRGRRAARVVGLDRRLEPSERALARVVEQDLHALRAVALLERAMATLREPGDERVALGSGHFHAQAPVVFGSHLRSTRTTQDFAVAARRSTATCFRRRVDA